MLNTNNPNFNRFCTFLFLRLAPLAARLQTSKEPFSGILWQFGCMLSNRAMAAFEAVVPVEPDFTRITTEFDTAANKWGFDLNWPAAWWKFGEDARNSEADRIEELRLQAEEDAYRATLPEEQEVEEEADDDDQDFDNSFWGGTGQWSRQ